jgi:ATP-binding cassette subfamily C (CFTR/MRP) protein 1
MLEIITGTLKIDGISLSTLRRHDLRAALVTVLQEPFLVPGTVRFNADPFLSTSSADIENALRRVGLWDVFSTPGSLDAPMDAAPLSQGQKQLFCVARALLRKVGLGNRDRGILVLDEISSHVDLATEKLMMDIVETEFRGWTVLAIAHQLSTLIDYDRVIVLDGGRIIEEGGPAELIGMEGGMFSELWRQQNL